MEEDPKPDLSEQIAPPATVDEVRPATPDDAVVSEQGAPDSPRPGRPMADMEREGDVYGGAQEPPAERLEDDPDPDSPRPGRQLTDMKREGDVHAPSLADESSNVPGKKRASERYDRIEPEEWYNLTKEQQEAYKSLRRDQYKAVICFPALDYPTCVHAFVRACKYFSQKYTQLTDIGPY